MKEQFKMEELAEESVMSLRKSYGNVQATILPLPGDAAQKLLVAGKVPIGWFVCHLREQISLKGCFKCLTFGHSAKACTSGITRSKRCRRCIVKHHIVKECKGPQMLIIPEVVNAWIAYSLEAAIAHFLGAAFLFLLLGSDHL